MESLKKFYAEMEQLEILHLGTLYAYDQTVRSLQNEIQIGSRKSNEPITRTLAPNYKYERVASNAAALRRKLKSEFPKILRETILIRIISALEVFLIDSLREIFLARKDLFMREDRLELSYAQLLSFDSISEVYTLLINKECRHLQNSGIRKIVGYYKNRIGIDIKNFPKGLKAIEEYHDRRNLLVHRLGKTDDKYKHDYNTREKKISVTKRYIISCFEDTRSLAKFVSDEAARVISHNYESKTKPITCVAIITIQIFSEKGEKVIVPDTRFPFGDKVLLVSDLLYLHRKDTEGNQIIELRGMTDQVDAYVNYLKSLKKHGYLKILNVEFVQRIGRHRRSFPEDFLQQIENILSSTPTATDRLEVISEKFGITRNQAKQALRQIERQKRQDMKEIQEDLHSHYPLEIQDEYIE